MPLTPEEELELQKLNEAAGVSEAGEISRSKDFLRQHEGFKSTAYQDTGGILTIGFGRTGKNVKPGMTTTPQKEAAWMKKRLNQEEVAFLKREGLPINASLISTVYNLGWPRFKKSSLYKLAKEGNWEAYANELGKFVHDAKKQKQPGLIRRRKEEADYIRQTLVKPTKTGYNVVELEGKRYNIPSNNIESLLKDHPNARIVD